MDACQEGRPMVLAALLLTVSYWFCCAPFPNRCLSLTSVSTMVSSDATVCQSMAGTSIMALSRWIRRAVTSAKRGGLTHLVFFDVHRTT